MDNHRITFERLNGIALVSLTLASKIEEREFKILKLTDIKKLITSEYSILDLKYIEILILKFLNWYLIIPTAATFVEFFIEYVISEKEYEMLSVSSQLTSFNDFKQLAIERVSYFLDLILLGECAQ